MSDGPLIQSVLQGQGAHIQHDIIIMCNLNGTVMKLVEEREFYYSFSSFRLKSLFYFTTNSCCVLYMDETMSISDECNVGHLDSLKYEL
jgi:hypothetical protein